MGIDVRVFSATHKNLAQLVAEGKFREDLFYRVNVIELRVPSLRERPEDVPELAEAVLRRLGRRMKITPPMLSKDALAALESYAFPGNVRELENILERAITLTTGGEIRAGDIQLRRRPRRAGDSTGPQLRPTAAHWATISRISSATPSSRRWNRPDIIRPRPRKALGMTFRALRYRIKKLGIE